MNKEEIRAIKDFFQWQSEPSTIDKKLSGRFQKKKMQVYSSLMNLRLDDICVCDARDFTPTKMNAFINKSHYNERFTALIHSLIFQNSSCVSDLALKRIEILLRRDTPLLILSRILNRVIITPKNSSGTNCILMNQHLSEYPTETTLYHEFCIYFGCNEAMCDNMKHCLNASYVPKSILPFCIFVSYLNRFNQSDASSISQFVVGKHLKMPVLDRDVLKSYIMFLRFLNEHLATVDYLLNLFMINHFLSVGDLVYIDCEFRNQTHISMKNHDKFLYGRVLKTVTKESSLEEFDAFLKKYQDFNAGICPFVSIEPMFCKRYLLKSLLKYETNHTVYTKEMIQVVNHLLTCMANELYKYIAKQEQPIFNKFYEKLWRKVSSTEMPDLIQTEYSPKDLLPPINSVQIYDRYLFLYNIIKDIIKEYRPTDTTPPTDEL